MLIFHATKQTALPWPYETVCKSMPFRLNDVLTIKWRTSVLLMHLASQSQARLYSPFSLLSGRTFYLLWIRLTQLQMMHNTLFYTKSSNLHQHRKLSLSIYHLLYREQVLYSLQWLTRSIFLLRSSRPTNKCRRRLLVLLRVPMIRRPIFLAYHTELSIVGWGWSVRERGSHFGEIELVSRLWPAPPSTSSYAGISKPVSAHSAGQRQKHTVQVATKRRMQGIKNTKILAAWRSQTAAEIKRFTVCAAPCTLLVSPSLSLSLTAVADAVPGTLMRSRLCSGGMQAQCRWLQVPAFVSSSSKWVSRKLREWDWVLDLASTDCAPLWLPEIN